MYASKQTAATFRASDELELFDQMPDATDMLIRRLEAKIADLTAPRCLPAGRNLPGGATLKIFNPWKQKPQARFEPGEKLTFMEAVAEIAGAQHIYECGKLQNSAWMQNQRIHTVKASANMGYYHRAVLLDFLYPLHSAITLARSLQADTVADGPRTLFRGTHGTIVGHYGTPPRAYAVEFAGGIVATLVGKDMRPAKEAS